MKGANKQPFKLLLVPNPLLSAGDSPCAHWCSTLMSTVTDHHPPGYPDNKEMVYILYTCCLRHWKHLATWLQHLIILLIKWQLISDALPLYVYIYICVNHTYIHAHHVWYNIYTFNHSSLHFPRSSRIFFREILRTAQGTDTSRARTMAWAASSCGPLIIDT